MAKTYNLMQFGENYEDVVARFDNMEAAKETLVRNSTIVTPKSDDRYWFKDYFECSHKGHVANFRIYETHTIIYSEPIIITY